MRGIHCKQATSAIVPCSWGTLSHGQEHKTPFQAVYKLSKFVKIHLPFHLENVAVLKYQKFDNQCREVI